MGFERTPAGGAVRWALALGLALCVGAVAPAVTSAERPKLAVMELQDETGTLTEELKVDLGEYLRKCLAASGRFVLIERTRQSRTLKRLVEEAKKESYKECYDKGCQIPLGKALSADSIVRVTISEIGGVFVVSAERIDLAKEAVVAGGVAHCPAAPASDRDRRLMQAANSVAEQLGGGGAGEPHETRQPGPAPPPPDVGTDGPEIRSTKVTEALGDLEVSFKPYDQVRLDLVSPDGEKIASGSPYQNRRAVPGRWGLLARARGHEPVERSFEVRADEPTLVKGEMQPLGGLRVEGTPVGASARVTGPHGFSHQGGIPWQASALRLGEYRVVVTRSGYDTVTRTATVQSGATARVQVELSRTAVGPPPAPAPKPKPEGPVVLYDEDFDQVPIGEVPRGWMAGNQLVVRPAGNGRALFLSGGRAGGRAIVNEVSFPEHFRFEVWATIPNTCWGAMSVQIGAFKVGNTCCRLLFDDDEVHECEFGSPGKLTIEQRGRVVTVARGAKQYFVKRLASTQRPRGFSIDLKQDNSNQVVLHRVRVTRLPSASGATAGSASQRKLPPGVFMSEDFSGVQEGALPAGWRGGDTVLVTGSGRDRALRLSAEKSNGAVTIPTGALPTSYRIRVVATLPNMCWGSMRLRVPGQFDFTNSCCKLSLDREELHHCDWGQRGILEVEKRGNVVTVALNGKRFFTKRISSSGAASSVVLGLGQGEWNHSVIHQIIGEAL